jgi:hypothetical protein
MPDEKPPDTPDEFTDLLTKLVRVPKEDIDAREREYQESKSRARPAKPGRIADGNSGG